MNKSVAIKIKQHALEAVESLSLVLNSAKEGCSIEDMTHLHREIGHLIGRLQIGVLEPIYQLFPELDDLSDKGSE